MRLAVACTCICALALAGCTNTAAQHPKVTSSPAPVGSVSAKAATKKVMGTSDKAKAIGTAKGTIDAPGSPSPVIADVIKVERLPDSTVLTWRLKSATGDSVATNSFQLSKPPFLDTRYVGLVDASAKKTYYAYTYAPGNQTDGQDVSCLCSGIPDEVGSQGTVLHSVLPPLPSALKTVDVTIPGFEAITGAQVTHG